MSARLRAGALLSPGGASCGLQVPRRQRNATVTIHNPGSHP